MQLQRIKISNYRALREVEMPLSAFVCLTGENNSGKSSVLQALSLFLSGTALVSSNYFDATKPIVIAVELSGIGSNDLGLLAPEHRTRIEPLISGGKLTLVRQYDTGGKSQLGYFGLVPKESRFSEAACDELMKGKKPAELRAAVVERFPELGNKAGQITSQKAAKELIGELAASLPAEMKESRFIALPTGKDFSITPMLPERIYIPAVKDLADDTKTTESSSFGKILGILLKVIEPKLAEDQALFERLSRKLTRVRREDGTLVDERLDEIKAIEASIQGFVQESFSAVQLKIEIPPPELRSVLSTARILANDGVESPLELKGDGLRRAVVFSILRAYVKLSAGAEAAVPAQRRYLLLFEEPELFLHPDAQRILFNALHVFSKTHQVVVTTHSPLFLGPDATATFVRLSRTTQGGEPKPFTSAVPVDLAGIGPRDEFQIICFENNNAAFFAQKVVLIEGDSDLIALPHIVNTLGGAAQAATKPTAFIRVMGKGSIRRYRSFFQRFGVKVLVVADLDIIIEGFDQFGPDDGLNATRQRLLEAIDAATAGPAAQPAAGEVRDAQGRADLRLLWSRVGAAGAAFRADPAKLPELKTAVDAFFAWERKSIRYEELRHPNSGPVASAKAILLAELRQHGVFVWQNGAIDDYYPVGVNGNDKPSRAQSFRNTVTSAEALRVCCPVVTCPISGETKPEFEFLSAFVAG